MSDQEDSKKEINNHDEEKVTRRSFLAGGAAGLSGMILPGGAAGQTTNSAESKKNNEAGRFAGKVVLITGATSGNGKGTAHAFAREAARVFFCGRRENLGKAVEAKIKQSGGEATYFRADVRREEDVKNFVEAATKKYGRLDIAFNNAGIATTKSAPLAEQSTADWLDVMTTNVTGYFLSMKYELPVLLKNEPLGAFGTRGIIINNASVSGHVGFGNIVPYSASKHAVIGLTRSASIEYGGRGIRINSISPGGVDTPMRNQAYIAQGFAPDKIPPVPNFQRRINTVEEIAAAVMFLAANDSSSIFGTDLD